MFRYIVLLWRAHHERSEQAAAGWREPLDDIAGAWRCALACPGIRIYVADERMPAIGALLLPNHSGAVLGTLFSRQTETGGEKSPPLHQSDFDSIAARGVPELLNRYWGRYVALLRKPNGAVHILRDPSGILPVLYTMHQGVHVVFSDLESIVQTFGFKLTINWKYLEAYVASPECLSRETGLVEVREVLPGECLCIANGSAQSSIEWNPFDIERLGRIEPFKVAVERAYHTIRHCVSSWAQVHGRIVHRLSGGLDSSIIAACIGGAGHNGSMTCLNYHDVGSQEDERFYARTMAESLGVRLIEYQRGAEALDLQSLSDIPYAPRPAHYLFYLEHVPLGIRVAQQLGASAILDGLGGDTLFYQSQGVLGFVDRVLAGGGARTSLLHTALDAAQMDGETVWSILRAAFHAVIKRDRDVAGPWTIGRSLPLPGKRQHILSTIRAPVPFYEPFSTGDAPDVIHPLLSQPIMEMFYRIPVYVLIEGGWDRAVVREAFARDVPVQIIRRRSKGAGTTSFKRVFQANRSFFADLLLNGELVERGLVPRQTLERGLSEDPRNADFATLLVYCVPLEMWLKKWSRGAGV